MVTNELSCVLVLYRKTPDQSQALADLRTFFREKAQAGVTLSLLVYDNSPSAASPRPEVWKGVTMTYRHDPRNLGLAVAYNLALQKAVESGRKWLLLLDQDTHLKGDFLDTLLEQLDKPANAVCALVPKLRQGQTILSPTWITQMREQQVEADFAGDCEKRVMALSSVRAYAWRNSRRLADFLVSTLWITWIMQYFSGCSRQEAKYKYSRACSSIIFRC